MLETGQREPSDEKKNNFIRISCSSTTETRWLLDESFYCYSHSLDLVIQTTDAQNLFVLNLDFLLKIKREYSSDMISTTNGFDPMSRR